MDLQVCQNQNIMINTQVIILIMLVMEMNAYPMAYQKQQDGIMIIIICLMKKDLG